jgi:hypothetical protein
MDGGNKFKFIGYFIIRIDNVFGLNSAMQLNSSLNISKDYGIFFSMSWYLPLKKIIKTLLIN